jgi:hypothetical protein
MLKLSSVPRMAGASVYSAPMLVDLHTHTYPASSCSSITYRDYVAWCVDNGGRGRRPHEPRRRLRQPQARAGARRRGRPPAPRRRDLDPVRRLRGLLARPRLPRHAARRAGRAAPRGGPRARRRGLGAPDRRRRAQRIGLLPGARALVARRSTAIEVYNGSWLGQRYVEGARRSPGEFGSRADRRQRRAHAGSPGPLHDAAAGPCAGDGRRRDALQDRVSPAAARGDAGGERAAASGSSRR